MKENTLLHKNKDCQNDEKKQDISFNSLGEQEDEFVNITVSSCSSSHEEILTAKEKIKKSVNLISMVQKKFGGGGEQKKDDFGSKSRRKVIFEIK